MSACVDMHLISGQTVSLKAGADEMTQGFGQRAQIAPGVGKRQVAHFVWTDL